VRGTPAPTTEQGVVQATRVADYVFTSPKPWKTFPVLFVLSLILGALVTSVYDWQRWLALSVGLFFIPAADAAIFAVPMARGLGGTLYMRRSTLLALISLFVLFPMVLAWRFLIGPYFGGRLSDILLFSWALVLWLWQLVLLTTSSTSHARSLPAALIMPGLGVWAAALMLPPFGLRELLLAAGFFAIFLLSAHAFKKMAESPLKRNFGASGMELVKNMLAHWTEGGESGKEGMEKFFSTFSVPFKAEIGVVGFRSGNKLKGLWLVPTVHPGPFGTLGGSDLPAKLKRKIAVDNLMIFHGPATHDQNPASDAEVGKLAAAARTVLDGLEYSKEAGAFRRVKGERVALCVQPLGKSVLAMHTSAPDPTDDVDHAVGHLVQHAFRKHGFTHPLFIDAHNCLERGGGAVHSGSLEAEELLRITEEAASATTKPAGALRAGFGSAGGFHKEKDGLGEQGIQVAVLEAGGRKAAYLLFDGNNMVKGLRELVLDSIKGMVDEAEVFTTDNHVVHATMGGYNPVGAKYAQNSLAQKAKETLQRALAGLEDVEVGVGSGKVQLRVFGHGNTARLTTAINSTVAILRVSVGVCLLGAFLGAFAWSYLVRVFF
jgi:putative membrane protein